MKLPFNLPPLPQLDIDQIIRISGAVFAVVALALGVIGLSNIGTSGSSEKTTTASPETTEPKPTTTKPAEPTTTKPAEPTTTKPAEPTTTKPAEPTTPVVADLSEYDLSEFKTMTVKNDEGYRITGIYWVNPFEEGKDFVNLVTTINDNYNSEPAAWNVKINGKTFPEITELQPMFEVTDMPAEEMVISGTFAPVNGDGPFSFEVTSPRIDKETIERISQLEPGGL